METPGPIWSVAHGRELPLDRPRIMAILNVTPDSFSDGGRFLDPAAAIERWKRCEEEGAAAIDIGGESTRPGAQPVSVEEQIRRVLPVVEAMAGRTSLLISIDTTSARVARLALDAGAHAINDVSAGTEDPEMLGVAAQARAGLILMHRLRRSAEDSYSDRYAPSRAPAYVDVVAEVGEYLRQRMQAAHGAGVGPERLLVDPGLGFGKTVEQNRELIARVHDLWPRPERVLSAASRKSFVGHLAGGIENPADRLAATLAVSIFHCQAGLRLFRVHDVAVHRHALSVAAALASDAPA